MNQQEAHNKFIFNPKIDSGFLFNLYEEDYPYILEVFTSTAEELDGTLADLANAYHSGSPAGLKKAAHKMKPLFGFTGLLQAQDAVAEFEAHCNSVTWLEALELPYQSLLTLVNEGKSTIVSEQKRLQEFLAS